MQPKKLEDYKFFQPIAWTVCIAFAAFVGFLAVGLKNTMSNIESSVISSEERLSNIEEAIGIGSEVESNQ